MSHRNRYQAGFCAAAWPLQGAAGVITPDSMGNYPGTLVNAPTWGTGPKGKQCLEFDGDDAYVNVGDVLELNEVPQASLCFWMNQDAIDVLDRIFRKYDDSSHAIIVRTQADGDMQIRWSDGALDAFGEFDYSTVISALNWHHIAIVFDGGQTGNADRLMCYVDGNPVTLAFTNVIPATTADLSGIDATIGDSTFTFDGRLWDMRCYTVPLSRDEVNQIIHEPVAWR